MRILSVLCLIALCVAFVNCKPGGGGPPDPEPTKQEIVTGQLTAGTGTWTPSGSGITVDGTDVTDEFFDGFTIKFSGNTFTTTGDTPVWLRSDTWHFKDEDAEVIIRGQDNKEIAITSISDTQLTLTLVWDQTTYEEEGGRQKSIPGTYVFTLNK